jgi:hypothetical protein
MRTKGRAVDRGTAVCAEAMEFRLLLAGVAPDTVAGLQFHLFREDGWSFGESGYYTLALSATAATYSRQEVGGPLSGTGTFSYTKTSDDVGILQLNDNALGHWTSRLTFVTPVSGRQQLIPPQGLVEGDGDSGAFLVGGPVGTAPPSFGGITTLHTASTEDDGRYEFVARSDGTYITRSLHPWVSDSTGTYTYQRTGTATAMLSVNDALAGPATVLLDFITAQGGRFRVSPGEHASLLAGGVFVLESSSDPGSGSTGPDFACSVEGSLPTAVVGGAKGRQSVRITNRGAAAAAGTITVSLYASADAVLDPTDQLTASTSKSMKLKPGASKQVRMKFDYPALDDGAYRLLAFADASDVIPESDEANNVAATASAVQIARPFVDLSGVFADAPVLRAGKGITASLSLHNAGNMPARGSMSVQLLASTDATLDDGDVFVGRVPVRVSLKPGATKKVRLRFPSPLLAGGQYTYFARIDADGQIAESDEANNITPPAAAV